MVRQILERARDQMIHIVYASIIAALIAFGVWYTERMHTSGYNQCTAEYESDLRQDLITSNAHIDRLERENNQLIKRLMEKQPEIQTIYKTIDREVVKYVPENPDCNLTRGAVRLRNIAGDPEQSASRDFYPDLSDDQAIEPSTITQQAGERQLHEWGAMYHELSGRYVALLEICGKQQE